MGQKLFKKNGDIEGIFDLALGRRVKLGRHALRSCAPTSFARRQTTRRSAAREAWVSFFIREKSVRFSIDGGAPLRGLAVLTIQPRGAGFEADVTFLHRGVNAIVLTAPYGRSLEASAGFTVFLADQVRRRKEWAPPLVSGEPFGATYWVTADSVRSTIPLSGDALAVYGLRFTWGPRRVKFQARDKIADWILVSLDEYLEKHA